MQETPDTAVRKEKIAVLGGGLAALAAVFELTSLPDHRDRYEITVYQMGFRLGGKGASGRNAAHGERIEEHGLHVLMGFYHNAFSLLRRCYAELARPAGAPLATIEEAIKPHDFLVLTDQVGDRWEPWILRFPPTQGKPGVGAPEPGDPWGHLKKVITWMYDQLRDAEELRRLDPDLDEAEADVLPSILREGVQAPKPRRSAPGPRRGDGAATAPTAERLDPAAVDPTRLAALIDDLDAGSDRRRTTMYSACLFLADLASRFDLPRERILGLLRRFRTWLSNLVARRIERDTSLRRRFTMLDLALTTVIGGLADGVDRAVDGWSSLDELDLCAWLAKHGASEHTSNGAIVRSLYNLVFAAPGTLAAGSMIHATLRITLDYKEGIFQKMQAGMGDVIFAPLYEVLARRGVKFAFFHRVDALSLSPDGQRVVALDMGVQARPRGDYQPLRTVKGLSCWPSEPDYDQLEDGEALRASGQNVESWWTHWPDVARRRLVLGEDFDRVILGISIGAFPFVAKELIAASPPFAAMVEHVKTTQTQAVQLWFDGPLGSLGWTLDSPVLGAFAGPFDTWADMSHLLPREAWPPEREPRSIAYVCSHLDDDEAVPGPDDVGYPQRQAERVRVNAVSWLEGQARSLWPATVRREEPFAWGMLVDAQGRRGTERLHGQYSQATYSPSERYVLAVPGSTKFRLRAGESGFANLVLAGDWVKNGLNVGCVEATVMAGMAAARAISGWPETIPGDG